MIIRFFKSSYLLQYLALGIIAVVMWIPAFIRPADAVVATNQFISPGYGFLTSIIKINSFLGTLLAFGVVLGSAILLNFGLEKYDLVPRNSLIPSMVFIVFMSHEPGLLWLYPALIPVMLIIIVLAIIMEIYNLEEAYTQIFNSGALIALATLFSFESFFFIIFIYLTYFIFRIYHWREWVIPLTGVLTIYIFIWVYFFWNDQLGEAFANYNLLFTDLSFISVEGPFHVLSLILLISITLLGIWSLIRIGASYTENILVTRKRLGIVFWFALITMIIAVFSGNAASYNKSFFITGISVLAAISLAQLKKPFWMEMIVGIILILAIINNYSSLLF